MIKVFSIKTKLRGLQSNINDGIKIERTLTELYDRDQQQG